MGMLLVTSDTGERRLFDTTKIPGPAFEPLREGVVQDSVVVKHSFILWLDGAIDIAPEYVLEHSFVYNEAPEDLPVG